MRISQFAIAVLAAVLVLPVLAVGATAGPAGASAAPLTIAFITSETGAAASDYTGDVGIFEARLDQQNAMGGVNGHKLVPLVIDDQTSPTLISTAIQSAIAKGAIGIVSSSPVFFLGAKYAQQAGVPVTGDDSDGPEWGTQPNTNMFSDDYGSLDPKYPVNTLYGKINKLFGGTRQAVYAIGISPNSVRANSDEAQSFARVGGQTPVNDTSVPFGSVDFTTAALQAKQANVNILWPNLDGASDFALAKAYKQAGIKLKAALLPDGFQYSVIGSPAWQYVQGDIFEMETHPFQLPDAGTEQMQAALEKYDHYSKAEFPSFTQTAAWLGADLMIKGLEGAGKNPTHASTIKSLRSIKSYNGNGLLPVTINYSTIFGHDPSICVWLMKAEKSGFVPVQKNPVCGQDIPGTAASSS
jgi:branched-chain amino acid transport system substrate-binding protein